MSEKEEENELIEINDKDNKPVAVKRGRGRPRKNIIEKEIKPVGRPKKYEKGYVSHRYASVCIKREEHERLLSIEEKYNEIWKDLIEKHEKLKRTP
jgi:hypothetical protein